MHFSGKTILVTGVASGIGAATAKLLTERGAEVIGFDLREPKAHVARYIPIDLSNPEAIAAAASEFEGKADALCNIAGVPPTFPPVLVLQVNFLGLRAFTEAMVPKLKDGGAIVNVASLAGMGWRAHIEQCKALFALESFDEVADFCAKQDITEENCYEFSKEAVIVWTMQNWNRWLRQARQIRINAISPAIVQTPIFDDFMQTVAVRARAGSEGMDRPRPGRAEEIAPIIAFLCHDDSRWLNGTNIPTDGGMLAAGMGHRMGF